MVKEWIKELAPVCGSDYCLCTEPHITISAIIANDEEAVRYDVKGRKYIETSAKYYYTDMGLRNARLL